MLADYLFVATTTVLISAAVVLIVSRLQSPGPGGRAGAPAQLLAIAFLGSLISAGIVVVANPTDDVWFPVVVALATVTLAIVATRSFQREGWSFETRRLITGAAATGAMLLLTLLYLMSQR
jgi:hypothetical protein